MCKLCEQEPCYRIGKGPETTWWEDFWELILTIMGVTQ